MCNVMTGTQLVPIRNFFRLGVQKPLRTGGGWELGED